MAKTSGIYCIENTANGKKYIGKAVDIEARWRCHKCELRSGTHINKYLQHAWNKYGESYFSFSVVEYAPEKELIPLEIEWIKRLGTFGGGYNLTAGGEGQTGRYLTDEQKQHLSNINMGKKNPNYGLKRSEETRKRMSEAMRGKKKGPMSDKQKQAISTRNKGKKKPWFNKKVVLMETGEVYASLSDAAKSNGIHISDISAVCRGIRKTTHKMHFCFMED